MNYLFKNTTKTLIIIFLMTSLSTKSMQNCNNTITVINEHSDLQSSLQLIYLQAVSSQKTLVGINKIMNAPIEHVCRLEKKPKGYSKLEIYDPRAKNQTAFKLKMYDGDTLTIHPANVYNVILLEKNKEKVAFFAY